MQELSPRAGHGQCSDRVPLGQGRQQLPGPFLVFVQMPAVRQDLDRRRARRVNDRDLEPRRAAVDTDDDLARIRELALAKRAETLDA